MISMLRAVSRLPVGSSANSTDGSATMARAIATRCIWPARELGRRVRFPPRQADGRQRLARPAAPLAGGHPAIDQRQLDVLERRRAIEQVESLKDEPEVVAAQQRALLTRDDSDVDAAEPVGARRSARRGSRGCSWRWTCRTRSAPSPRRTRLRAPAGRRRPARAPRRALCRRSCTTRSNSMIGSAMTLTDSPQRDRRSPACLAVSSPPRSTVTLPSVGPSWHLDRP